MTTKLLIVDDSPVVRSQVRDALRSQDCLLLEAEQGRQAIELIAENPDLELLLCDINMPVMGGIALLEALERQDHPRNFRVVMLTSELQPELIRRARSLGASAWLQKPLDTGHLLEIVQWLH